MSTQTSRIPLPCRYFHTPQGCPYGKGCKYDHYSNNPSYFNYIKQRLHQISKPHQSNDSCTQNMVHIIIESMQQCITDIMNKQLHGLYQEISALKSTIQRQHKWIQTKNAKPLSQSTFTKHIHKITKLLKQNHAAIRINHKSNRNPSNAPQKGNKTDDHEWDNIFTTIRAQLQELQEDKQLFETQMASVSSTSKSKPNLHPNTTKLAPPPNRNKRTRTKRKRDPSPFDNIARYDNVFEAPIPVTMDQISALPIPPKRKPNPIKKNKKSKATNVMALSMTSEPKKPPIVMKSKSKKTKRNHNKHYIRRKQAPYKSKKKLTPTLNDHNVNTRLRMPLLPFNFMNDTDFYQIVRSDSSEDDESNMTTEDVAKLDMLDSI